MSAQDIMITVATNVKNALSDLANLEKTVKSVQTSATGAMGKATSTMGNLRNTFTGLKTTMANTGTQMKDLAKQSGLMGQGFTFLKGALSGVVGMLGYDLVAGLMEGARASINARGNIEAFSQRLDLSASEMQNFNNQLTKYQAEFRKVDMQTVGATALELADKLDVPTNKIGELTRMTAVMSSAFIHDGGTAENAILAVSDALDGQFRRLQEIGITQDILKKNGWNGNLEDTEGLIDAINLSMDELGLSKTAAQVATLDDAWQVLNVSMSQLLTEILIPLTPLLVGLITALSDAASAMGKWWASMPDGAKIAVIAGAIGVVAFAIGSSLVTAIVEAGGAMAYLEASSLPLMVTFLEVAVVVGALVLVFYEVGKAMGWWTDGASAMQVISAALQNAFNQLVACLQTLYNGFMEVMGPQVTALWNELVNAVKPLRSAFSELRVALGQLGAAFGGASGSGNLFATIGRVIATTFIPAIAIIRGFASVIVPVITFVINVITGLVAILIALKKAFDVSGLSEVMRQEMVAIFNAITGNSIFAAIIDLAIAMVDSFKSALGINSPGFMAQAIQDEMNNIAQFITGAVGTIVAAIVNLGMSIWNGFTSALGSLAGVIQSVILQIRTIAGTAVGLMVQYVIQRFMALVTGVRMVFMMVVNAIRLRLNQARAIAGTLATMIRTAIVTRLQTLVARVRTFFTNVVSAIRQRMTTAVSTAKQKAKQILDGIKNKVAEIPDKVKEEFDKIKDRISSALDAAKNVAVSKIGDLVAAVKGALGIASPGFIQRMVTSEFNSIPGIITDSGIQAASNAAKAAQGIVGAWDSSINPLGVAFGQFDAFNPLNAVTSIGNMNAGIGTGTMNTMNQRTVTNNNGNSVVYHVDHMTVDLNNLPGNEKERFYNMLSDIARGA